MLLDLLLRGGQVLTRSGLVTADVGVRDGLIVAIGRYLSSDRVCPVYDVRGQWVVPGMIECLGRATRALEGTAATQAFSDETRRAAVAGVTLVCEEVVPKPWEPLGATVTRRAKELHTSWVDRCFAVRVMSGQLPDVAQIAEARAVGLSLLLAALSPRNDGFGLDDRELYDLLVRAAQAGVRVAVSLEQPSFAGVQAPARVGVLKRLEIDVTAAQTVAGERVAAARALGVCETAKAPLCLSGVTHPATLVLVTEARARGVKASAQVLSHSLLLSRAVYRRRRGAWYLPEPPLRDKESRAELWRRLRRGEIDTVAWGGGAPPDRLQTSHTAPLPMLPWAPASYLSHAGRARVSLARSHGLVGRRAAYLLGFSLERGMVEIGAIADLCVIDIGTGVRLGPKKIKDGATFNPLMGQLGLTAPRLVINRGAVVAEQGVLKSDTAHGRLAVPFDVQT